MRPTVVKGTPRIIPGMPFTRPFSPTERSAATVIALLFLLLPAIGSWSETLVQDTLKSALLAIGTLVATVLFAAYRQRTPASASQALRWHPVLLIPIALTLYALFSMAWSHAYLAGTAAARWCIVGLVMGWALNGVQRSDVPRLLAGLHGGACLAGVWAACQFWLDCGFFTEGPSPAATFYNRNFYAEFAVSVLPFSCWLLAQTATRRSRWWVGISTTWNLCTILMTSTRSALLALVILTPMLLIALIRHYRMATLSERPHLRRFGLACVALALILVNLPSQSTHLDATTPGITAWQRSIHHAAAMAAPGAMRTGSLSIRRELWTTTLRMLWANPWGGVGAGAWEIEAPRYQSADQDLELDYYAHNEYLQLLSEYGSIVGGGVLALLGAILLQAANAVYQDFRTPRPNAAEPCAAAVALPTDQSADRQQRFYSLLALVALLTVSCVGFPWHLATTAGLLGLSLGLLCSATRAKNTGTFTPQPATAIRGLRWLMVAAALGCGVAIYATQRAVRAEHQLVTALRIANQLPKDRRPQDAEMRQRKADMLDHLRAGIALNPHYRWFIPLAAEVMMQEGDWRNAAWILAITTQSRPAVYALWKGQTQAAIALQDGPAALQAFDHLRALHPTSWTTRALGIEALSIAGHDDQARALLTDSLDHADSSMDYEIAQAGYVLALKLRDQPLAIRVLTLRNQYWPAQAADGFWRMGHAYANLAPLQQDRALAAFREGLDRVPDAERDRFVQSVPQPYQEQLRRSIAPRH